MAVVAACIPTIRPLVSTLLRSPPSVRPVKHNDPVGGSSVTSKWSTKLTWRTSKSQSSNGSFSRLEEQLDDRSKPMGHDVSVHGGAIDGRDGSASTEKTDIPERGIQVKTEIFLISSERLEYEYRLF